MSTGNAQAKLDHIAGTKTAIKSAIEAKGVVVGNATFRQYADIIGEIPEPSVGDYLVRFIDFDGTIIKEEWVDEGESATAPDTPTHNYLTFNSWNRAFTNVTENRDVGAIYNTIDGKTYLWIRVTNATGLKPTIHLNKANAAPMTINWGDANTSESSSHGDMSFNHTYLFEGDYLITIECSGVYKIGRGTTNTPLFGWESAQSYVLKKAYLGNTVTEIQFYGFRNNRTLASISIPTNVAIIGNQAFQYCYNLKSITIPTNVASIRTTMFDECKTLKSVVIPTSVNSIADRCFRYCYSLKSITIPSSVKSIGTFALDVCYNLTSVTISTGVTSIESYVFRNCYSLKSINIPSGVTSIADTAFSDCYSLESITIPSSVISIGTYAFSGCHNLTAIIIPSNIVSIGLAAFSHSWSISDFQVLPITPPTLGSGAFMQINAIIRIYVPDASTLAYRSATNWVVYADYIYPISNKDGDAVILFNVDGGNSVSPLVGTEGEIVAAEDIPAAPSKESKIFAGWYKDEAFTEVWDWETDVFPKFNLTLYAKWEDEL